jgi:hypothetical protein
MKKLKNYLLGKETIIHTNPNLYNTCRLRVNDNKKDILNGWDFYKNFI